MKTEGAHLVIESWIILMLLILLPRRWTPFEMDTIALEARVKGVHIMICTILMAILCLSYTWIELPISDVIAIFVNGYFLGVGYYSLINIAMEITLGVLPETFVGAFLSITKMCMDLTILLIAPYLGQRYIADPIHTLIRLKETLALILLIGFVYIFKGRSPVINTT